MSFQFFDELRAAAIVAAVAGLSFGVGAENTVAPSQAPVPEGWTLSSDGSYSNPQSGIYCPKAMGSYALARLDGPAEPNRIGTCVYSAGEIRIGEIRVRKFVDGVGETPLAISNDRALMGGGGGPNVPPGGKLAAAYRVGPGPEINGTQTQQIVITSVHGGLLVDCIAQMKPDKAERDYSFDNFIKGCPHLGK